MFPVTQIFFIGAILIFMQISTSTYISNYQDSVYYLTKDDNYSSLKPSRRYGRQIDSDRSCEVTANSPQNKYQILGPSKSNPKSGDYVPNYTALETICDAGYKLGSIAPNISFCIDGSWVPPLSTCSRSCPSLTSIRSTNVKCSNGPVPLDNCYDPIEGTTVFLTCNPMYEESNIEHNPVHICIDGSWEPAIPQCYPVCGLKRPEGVTNIIKGQKVTLGDYPWHVGIYNSLQLDYLCGGAIIDRNIVLSAAHCFTNSEGVLFPSANYMVAAGKYHRNLLDSRDPNVQFAQIKEIKISDRYRGSTTFQALDIAVLILKNPFLLSIAVQPVCIELNEDLPQLQLSLHGNGVVIGWGFTQEGSELSDVLKEVNIPYVPFDRCYNEIPTAFRKFFTPDKICGGYLNSGIAVCGGDSGGGYVFNKVAIDRYFIKGVVSTSPATDEIQQCDSNQYSLYTSVAAHIPFVRNILIRNRIRVHLECRQDRCAYADTEYTSNLSENDIICGSSLQSTSRCHMNQTIDTSCRLPSIPKYGVYSLDDDKVIYTPGNYVKRASTITLICNTGYEASPSGITKFFCVDEGQWSPHLGICIKALPVPTSEVIHIRLSRKESSYQGCQDDGEPLRTGICTLRKATQVARDVPYLKSIAYDYNENWKGEPLIEWDCNFARMSELFSLTRDQCESFRTSLYYINCKYDKCSNGQIIRTSEETADRGKCCATDNTCNYFYFSCRDTLFKRMVDMIF